MFSENSVEKSDDDNNGSEFLNAVLIFVFSYRHTYKLLTDEKWFY